MAISYPSRYGVTYNKQVLKLEQYLIPDTSRVFFTDGTSNECDRFELDKRIKQFKNLDVTFNKVTKVITFKEKII